MKHQCPHQCSSTAGTAGLPLQLCTPARAVCGHVHRVPPAAQVGAVVGAPGFTRLSSDPHAAFTFRYGGRHSELQFIAGGHSVRKASDPSAIATRFRGSRQIQVD